MSHWFSDCTTVAEIKKRYRQLAMQHHPDRGGDVRIMQSVNNQYHAALAAMHETAETGSDGKRHTYYYNAAHEQDVIDKLSELLRARLPGCDIWLIGKWLWVVGETRPVKETLKSLGLRWHGKRSAWYWKPTAGRSRYNGRVDLEGLAASYGAKVFAGQDSDAAMVAL